MNLTQRETEIVSHLATGKTCDEIAESFSRSVLTVRTQVKNACQRVGARNIPHLVAIAISKGFISGLPIILCAVMLLGTDDGMRRGGRTHRLTRREAEVQIFA